jgi:hypothetical protein
MLLSKQSCRGLGNIKDHLYGSPHNHTKELPPPKERIDRRGESSVLGGSMRGAPKHRRAQSNNKLEIQVPTSLAGGSHQQWNRFNQMMGSKVSTNPALADFAFEKSATPTSAGIKAVGLTELSTEWRTKIDKRKCTRNVGFGASGPWSPMARSARPATSPASFNR